MASITNFKPGETLTAEALNQAFNLVGARADAVIEIAQEAKTDAAEALAKVDQATERVPELIEKVKEMEEVIPNLATAASVTAAQAAAQSYADTVGVNTAATAKAYTDSQVETIDTQIETISSELTAQGAEIDEVAGALEGKADTNSVYTKSETYTKSQVNDLYDVLPQLSSGTVIAQVKTPAGTKPLYAPSGGGGGGGVTIEEVDAEIEGYLEGYSTTAEMNTALAGKADASTTYTKTQVDNALAAKANASTTYTKTEVNAALANKADVSSVYTADQVDTLLEAKADIGVVYDKSVVDAKLAEKLDSNIYYGYVNNRPIDTYLYINYPGMPETADADFTVYASLNNDTTKDYEVTVVLDDPALRFKSITYDANNTRYAITFPKEAAGHTCRVHIQEVLS